MARGPTDESSAGDLLDRLTGGDEDDGRYLRAPRREGPGFGAAFLILFVLVLFAALGYTVAYLLADDRVPRGTTVSGVDVGGLSPADAAATLRRDLGARTAQPLTVQIGLRTRTLRTVQTGVSIDYDATVAQAGAFASWQPGRLWDYWTGGSAVTPVVETDQTVLDRTVRSLAAAYDRPAVNGRVSFDADGGIVTDEPRTGLGLDRVAAGRALSAAAVSATRTVRLPLLRVQPQIGPDDVQAALNDFANAAASAPVTLQLGRTPVRMTPRQYLPTVTLAPSPVATGGLVPRLDSTALARLVHRRYAAADPRAGRPVDAAVRLVGGVPQVLAARPGASFDTAAIVRAFLAAVVRPSGERTETVTATPIPASFTTAAARALGVTEAVSTSTVPVPAASAAVVARAAARVDGTLLRPGQTFSLAVTVGDVTDLSPLATALDDAAFQAGLREVSRTSPTVYLPGTPDGRESTTAGGADLRFADDTAYGVLVQAGVTPQGALVVTLWSTRTWDVTSSTSSRYGLTPPATRTLSSAGCVPSTGSDGFSVDVTRTFRKPGQTAVDHQETTSTTYSPSDRVVCTTATP